MKTAAFSAAELRFGGWIPRAPDLSDFYAKGRGGLQPGASRDSIPPWGRPKADWAARTSSRRSSKADRPARTSSRRSAKADRAARTSSRRSGKADRTPGVCHGEARKPTRLPDFFTAKCESRQRRSPLLGRGFSGRAAGRNGALPYNARKSQFLRNGDVWATESLFLFAVLWLAFLPDQSETGVAGGGKARRPETPAAPRRPRPTTATGSRFLRRQRKRPPRRPRPSPPAREGSLGAPNQSACSRRLSGCPQRPNLSARRRAESPKGKRKGGTPDETRTAALTTAPPEDGWEGSQPKRPQRRGKPAKRPRRSAS